MKTRKGWGWCAVCEDFCLQRIGVEYDKTLWACPNCGGERRTKVKHEPPPPETEPSTTGAGSIYKMLRDLMVYEIDSEEAILLITEELARLDRSTTEGGMNPSDRAEFDRINKLIHRLCIVKGLMQASGLTKYVPFAIRQLIRNIWGPRPPTIVTGATKN